MTHTDGPVCLTHLAPDNAYAGHLLFYDVVPASVVSRSGVLSSILEAGGDADTSLRLPDFVTLAEFKLWSSTITAAEEVAECKDIAHACTVLKAADALDDRCFKDWLQVTVSITRQRALAHHRSGARNLPDDISAALLSLPDHLHHRVLEVVARPASAFPGVQWEPCAVQVWLDLLPSSHHVAILQSIISPDKALTFPTNDPSLPFLQALAMLPASPPSLLSLTVLGPFINRPGSSRPPHLQEKRDALAAALCHHSSLASLQLDQFCDSDSMKTLAPAIATLTSLQTLCLGSDHQNGVPHSALPQMKAALYTLSSLQQLKLFIGLPPTWEFLQDCPHELDHDLPIVNPQLQHCLGSALSGVTSLTSLDIDESWGHWRLKPSVPLSLPHLNHLKINSMYHNVASVLLRQLNAPLITLVIGDRCGHDWKSEDLALAQQLWTSLQKHVQLKSLDIDLGINCETTEMEARMLAGAPAALASLPCLEELKISSAFPVLLRLAQELAARDSGLQRFMFSCGTLPDRVPPTTAQKWGSLLTALSQLPLRHLHMGIERRSCGRSFPGLAALQPLTQLTALRLFGWRSCLRSEVDCQALAGMQQLRSLCMESLVVPDAGHADCVRTLGALPNLTELAFQALRLDDGLNAAFIQHAPGAPWLALEWLALDPASAAEAGAFAQAVAAFPALQVLMLADDEDWPRLGEGTPARTRIEQIASDAEFVVDVDWDWSHFDWDSEYM